MTLTADSLSKHTVVQLIFFPLTFREETQGLPGNLFSHFSLFHIFQVCMTPPVLPLSTHPSPSKLCSCHWVLLHSRRRAIGSPLNVDFGIKMTIEDCPHSQPRKIYHHTGKQVQILHESTIYTWVRPKHSSRGEDIPLRASSCAKDQSIPGCTAAQICLECHLLSSLKMKWASLPCYDRHVKYFWEKTASKPYCWRSSELVPHIQFHMPEPKTT